MQPELPEENPAPLIWAEVQIMLAGAAEAYLQQPAVLCIVVPADAAAGTQLFVPVAGGELLNENVFETAEGLCPASALLPAEFQAAIAGELPLTFPAGQLVLTNMQRGPAPETTPEDES